MNIKVQSSEFDELNRELVQQAETATVVAGTGSFIAPIAMLRRLAPNEIQQLVDDLEEQENLYAMAVLGSGVTGIANTLWYIPVPGGQHGPRIKVAIDPPHAMRPGGVEATVPFDAPAIGPMSRELESRVRAFIEITKAALLDYWDLNVTTDQFIARLRSITPR